MHSIPQTLIDRLGQPDGGFTWNPRTGKTIEARGFAVSPFKGREMIEQRRRVTGPLIDRYVQSNADKLATDRRSHVGAWHNPANGLIYVDVSIVVGTRSDAKRIAKKFQQLAYYDFAAGKSVDVAQKSEAA